MSDENYPEYTGPCKHFHQEPYYTPNNYDLQFDPNSIPSNLPVELANTLDLISLHLVSKFYMKLEKISKN